MAAENHTTQSVQIVAAPFGMPRVEMPPDAVLDHSGHVAFVLDTMAGPVHVRAYWYEWACRGTVPALLAAGLIRIEWLPGLPGNKKTRQQILFDSTGPRLLVGCTSGKKQTQPHITVCRLSSRTFVVEIQATPEQSKRLEIFHEQRAARRKAEMEKEQQAAYEKNREEERIARWNSETPEDVRGELVRLASSAKSLLSCRLSDSRFRYTEDVMTEVNQHLDAAKQALLAGKILPKLSQSQRNGNVVYLPGAA